MVLQSIQQYHSAGQYSPVPLLWKYKHGNKTVIVDSKCHRFLNTILWDYDKVYQAGIILVENWLGENLTENIKQLKQRAIILSKLVALIYHRGKQFNLF